MVVESKVNLWVLISLECFSHVTKTALEFKKELRSKLTVENYILVFDVPFSRAEEEIVVTYE